MKYCPNCDAKFDDDVMRFCTKDGTPLIDEKEPNFVEMPSAPVEEAQPALAATIDDDEAGEVTVVRKNISIPPPPDPDEDFSDVNGRPADRIVVSTTPAVDPIRNRTSAVYYPPPKQNTALVVVLTIIGTVVVLALAGGLFWALQKT